MRSAIISSLLLSCLLGFSYAATFNIDAQKSNATIFAISAFIETNINRGDDGGLYAVSSYSDTIRFINVDLSLKELGIYKYFPCSTLFDRLLAI